MVRDGHLFLGRIGMLLLCYVCNYEKKEVVGCIKFMYDDGSRGACSSDDCY